MSITFLGLSPAARNQNIDLHGVYNAETFRTFLLLNLSLYYAILFYMIFRIACNVYSHIFANSIKLIIGVVNSIPLVMLHEHMAVHLFINF